MPRCGHRGPKQPAGALQGREFEWIAGRYAAREVGVHSAGMLSALEVLRAVRAPFPQMIGRRPPLVQRQPLGSRMFTIDDVQEKAIRGRRRLQREIA
jgi:hypothetical protein